MTYAELLLTEEWKNRRLEILKRDKLRCSKCSNLKLIKGSTEAIFVFSHLSGNLRLFSDVEGVVSEYLKFPKDKFQSVQELIVYYQHSESVTNIIAARRKSIHEYSVKKIRALVSQFQKSFSISGAIKITATYLQEPIDEIKKALDETDLESVVWEWVNGLHVHHEYYRKGWQPWEYPDSALTTLCWQCHETLHRAQMVPVYDCDGSETDSFNHCKKCHGAGVFPQYEHVERGICFQCGGAKYEELIEDLNFH